MSRSPAPPSLTRARRTFWLLVLVSVLAAGALSDALASPPATATGLRVAGSGLLLTVSVALAARVLLAVDHATAKARNPSTTAGEHRRRRQKGKKR